MDRTRQEILNAICELRAQEMGNQDIAKTLDIPMTTLTNMIHVLIRKGKIVPKIRWLSSQEKKRREGIILRMLREHATYDEIGRVLGGITGERVRGILKDMMEKRGPGVLGPRQEWTVSQAQRITGIPDYTIRILCAKGEIPSRLVKRHRYMPLILLNRKSLQALRRHPHITRKRTCCVCSMTFTLRTPRSSRSVCYKKRCIKVQGRMKRERVRGIKPQSDYRLQGWHKKLWHALNRHARPDDEQWIPLRTAAQVSGLSYTQLYWLGFRNLVERRPPSVEVSGHRSCALYAKSEVVIAGRIWRAHMQSHAQSA